VVLLRRVPNIISGLILIFPQINMRLCGTPTTLDVLRRIQRDFDLAEARLQRHLRTSAPWMDQTDEAS
jgi:hypothetical protein